MDSDDVPMTSKIGLSRDPSRPSVMAQSKLLGTMLRDLP
jgi:hypothetical protein